MAKSKTSAKGILIRFIILLVVGAMLFISVWKFENKINVALGLVEVKQERPAYGGKEETEIASDKVLNLVWDEFASENYPELSVHFIDVGQGDACVVVLPDDKTILIDGGDRDTEIGQNLLSYIETNVKKSDGSAIEYIDYAILTHPDADHCGSMDVVLNEYPAKNFYRPNVLASRSGYSDPGKDILISGYSDKDTVEYMDAIEAGHANGANIFINSIDLDPIVPEGIEEGEDGYYELSFYGPESPSYTDWNDYSPIMILEYEGIRMALTGDCEKHGEEEFAQNVEDAKTDNVTDKFDEFTDEFYVDVIKLGHHGSRTSTGPALVEAITTETSVSNTLLIVSCGEGNSYGHPHPEKIDELLEAGFKEDNILRTDTMGSIVLSVSFDEESGEMRLFVGDEAMDKMPEPQGITWKTIAIIIFAVLFVILFGSILFKGKKRRRR